MKLPDQINKILYYSEFQIVPDSNPPREVAAIGTEMLTMDMLNHFLTAEPKEVFVKFDTTQWTVEYKDTNYRITACKDVIYVVRKLK